MPVRLTLDEWDALPPPDQTARARAIAADLPEGFRFRRLRSFRLGRVARRVAEFTFGTARFMLIPGGPARLGRPDLRTWAPTSAEAESWDDTAEEYGIETPLRRHIIAVTRPPRRVTIRPLLMEAEAAEVGWLPADPSDPPLQALVGTYLRGRRPQTAEIHSGSGTVRLVRDAAGVVTATRAAGLTHAAYTAELRAQGFRLPTENEWEYACDAGAGTLFRWGDHAPWDRYPVDPGRRTADSPHLRPNGFGLLIASNPYHNELVAEAGRTRGGDGGSMVCGGAGYFISWLTLATAYRDDEFCAYDPAEPLSPGYTFARRVFPLG